jgi:hypothetical protein
MIIRITVCAAVVWLALVLLYFAAAPTPPLSAPPAGSLDKVIAGTTNYTVTMATDSYTFEPKDDITAPELAKVFGTLMPAFSCHNSMGYGCDVRGAIAALPPEVARHFVRHAGSGSSK